MGLVEQAKLMWYTGKIGRVEAVSAAAACGIQAQVAAEHFRMLSEQTLQKYDRMLSQERGAVRRAMQGRVEAARR